MFSLLEHVCKKYFETFYCFYLLGGWMFYWTTLILFSCVYPRFIYAISRSLPLFLVLAWVLSVAMICKSIVYEKENRLKEVMKIMGLSNGVHWVAWFINAFVMMFITIVILTIIIKVMASSSQTLTLNNMYMLACKKFQTKISIQSSVTHGYIHFIRSLEQCKF